MEEELDLTNAHLNDEELEEVPIPDHLQGLDLTANRLKRVNERILHLKGLTSLSFRQNLLQDASAFKDLQSAPVLKNLILHDNQLTKLPPLSDFKACEQLEVSYNAIRSIEGLKDFPTASLQQFYAACNKISEIEGLERLSNLRILELGGNRIRSIKGLDSLQKLEELWLGRNRLETVSGLSSLSKLQQLSLQSNRLTSLAGLESCATLQELYVSHNGIANLHGLENLTELRVLDVSNNQISIVEGIDSLKALEDLWLNDNQIQDAAGLPEGLAGQRASLTCIYLSENPVVQNLGSRYKSRLKELLPKLEQIDADVLK